MPHAHFQRPQHRYFGMGSRNGRCNATVQCTRGVVRCGMLVDDACHRFYPCRQGCARVDFASIEVRDRHEADVHGSGW